MIEHDNNQMEVNDGNLTIDHVQKPRQMIEVRYINFDFTFMIINDSNNNLLHLHN